MDEREILIREVLHEFKVKYTYKGYSYLYDGLLLLLDDRYMLSCLRKGLYLEIGEKYGVKSVNVEKGIRTIKSAMWEMNRHHPMFKNLKKCPTNGEFIDLVLYEIEQRLLDKETEEKNDEQQKRIAQMFLKREVELMIREQKVIKMERQLQSRLTSEKGD